MLNNACGADDGLRSDIEKLIELFESEKRYVPRFFTTAIISETPEAFKLSTPSLSTLPEKGKLSISMNPEVTFDRFCLRIDQGFQDLLRNAGFSK